MQKHTSESIRQTIAARTKELEILLSQPIVDHLAVEELRAANVRDTRQLKTLATENIVATAKTSAIEFTPRPEVAAMFARFFPNAQTVLTPGAFRATR